MFDFREQKRLLKLAREAIVTYLETRTTITSPQEDFLKTSFAAFVTLKLGNNLRGCIGSIDASDPLGDTIIYCAISAAFRDPRFQPLNKEEYPLIHLEISLLSAFERITNPEEIITGTHGVMITHQRQRGLLLPQVATEYDWDRDSFLGYVCRKAGLPPNAWKDTSVIMERFTAVVFGEKDENGTIETDRSDVP